MRKIVDAWMQHPGRTVLADPMFDSLRAWSRGSLPKRDIPIEWTLAAMDEAAWQSVCSARGGGRRAR